MNELKLRLEYLEQISKTDTQDSGDSLLKQADALGARMNELVGISQQEVLRQISQKQPAASEAPEMPFMAQKQIIQARSEALAKLAATLNVQSMEIPEPPPEPPVEAAQRLMTQASELGREFDELTVRSTELTQRLLDQVVAENAAVASRVKS